jgi:CHAT domain-containing protein
MVSKTILLILFLTFSLLINGQQSKFEKDSLKWEQLYSIADSLLFENFQTEKELKKFLLHCKKTVNAARKTFGDESKPYIKSLLALNQVLVVAGKISDAEKINAEGLELINKAMPEQDEDYVDTYSSFIEFSLKGILQKIQWYEQLINIAEKKHPGSWNGIATDLAKNYINSGFLKKADSVLSKIENIATTLHERINWSKTKALLLEQQENISGAIQCYDTILAEIESKEILELPRRDSRIYGLYKTRAKLLFKNYNYAAAYSSWTKYLNYYKEHYSNYEWLNEQLDWPNIYQATNQRKYYKALYEKYKNTAGNTIIKQNEKLRHLVSYYEMSESGEVPEWLQKDQLATSKLLIEKYYNLYSEKELAEIYISIGERQKARAVLFKQLEKRKKQFGYYSPEYAEWQIYLASYLAETGDTTAADSVYIETQRVYEKLYGDNSVQKANVIHFRGHLFWFKQPQKAYELFKESFTELKNNSPDTANYEYRLRLLDLLELSYQLNDTSAFFDYAMQLLNLWKDKFIENVVMFGEEQQQWLLKHSRLGINGMKLKYLMPAYKKWFLHNQEYTRNIYTAFKTLYSSSLVSELNVLSAFFSGKTDYWNSKKYQELVLLKKMLENNPSLEVADLGEEFFTETAIILIKKFRENRGLQYYILDNAIAEYKNKIINQIKSEKQKDPASLNKTRKPGTTLFWINYPDDTDSLRYGVFISSQNDSALKYIDVCGHRQIDSLMNNYYGNYNTRGIIVEDTIVTTTKNVNTELYKLLWGKIATEIDTNTLVYNIPTGILNKISFNALQDENGKFLIDKYRLKQLIMPDDADTMAANWTLGNYYNVYLFGGADFDAGKPGTGADNLIRTGKLDGQPFTYLPGTLKEIQAISDLLKKDSTINVFSFTGDAANESNFKKYPDASILHIATHGFYLPPPQQNDPETELTDNPLARTGFILSGANNHLKTDLNKEGNGIITAYKIYQTQPKLPPVLLVVLSACETALGDVNYTQGVLGLQRAFRIKGVERMIISLWPVPDNETAELMTAFYTNLANKETFFNAFSKAQKAMKEKYKDPYKWAGFVYIGE